MATGADAVVGVAAVAWVCCWPRGVWLMGIDCRDAPKEAWGGWDSLTEDSEAESRDEVECRSSITWKREVDTSFRVCIFSMCVSLYSQVSLRQGVSAIVNCTGKL